jgi:hypothetical protein
VSLSLCFSLSLCLSISIFREFICVLDGNAIKINDPNFIELEQFCEDFDFTELGVKLFDFRPSMNFTEGATASEAEAKAEAEAEVKTETEVNDVDARGRIAAHEEKANQHSAVSAGTGRSVAQFANHFKVSGNFRTVSNEAIFPFVARGS